MNTQSFQSDEYPVVLFDSQCLVCDFFIRWIIKKDKKRILKFSGLQSNKSQAEITQRDIPIPEVGTVILLSRDRYFTESDAVLEILKITEQSLPTRLVELFPKSSRDRFYRWIAHNRYRFYKKRQHCPVPDSSEAERFI